MEFSGSLSATVFACETCFKGDLAEFRERQRQFQELIDAGVPRASANLIMIGRINQGVSP